MPIETRRVFLVRHGEVHNPGHLVYADLPGFDLSDRGREQARAASDWLSSREVAGVWSSPLARALATAEMVASPHRLPVRVLPELTEWDLLHRWRGIPWEEVPTAFPGELEAYLEDPRSLPRVSESLGELAHRMRGAIERASIHSAGPVVVVGHQDPIQAAIRDLTGRGPAEFHRAKPGHAEVVTLEGLPWRLVERVTVDQGAET